VDNEERTVLNEAGKSAPELTVDNELVERMSLPELPLEDGTGDKVDDKTDKKDDEDNGGEDLTAAGGTAAFRFDVGDVNTAASFRIHEECDMTLVGLFNVIEVARIGVLLADHT